MTKADCRRALASKRATNGLCIHCGDNPIDIARSKRGCTACLDVLLDREKQRFADGKKIGTSAAAKEAMRNRVRDAGFRIIHTSRKRDGKSKNFCLECSKRKAANQKRHREKRGTAVGTRRAHRFKVTHHDGGYVRARAGKVAMWGKTEEEAVERLKRKLVLFDA